MENQKQEKNVNEARIVVNYDNPSPKSPPSLSVGPVGWVRENLFGSPFDTILTVLSILIIVATTVSVIGWAIGDANWLAVNQNWRNFMAGTYPIESIWRLNVLVYLAAVMTGFSIATYSRAGRDTLIIIGVLLAIFFAVPLIANALLPNPSTFISAGVVDVQSGTVTESPSSQIAFTALKGTTVQVTIPTLFDNDTGAVGMSGFADRPTSAYYNAARNRLGEINALEEINRSLAANERLDGGLLSCSQFIDAKREQLRLYDRLADFAVNEATDVDVDDSVLLSCEQPLDLPETEYREITEIYNVNTSPADVRILSAAGELLGEATLQAGEGVLSVELPEDAWYVLESSVAAEEVLVVLDAINIYPIIERSVTQILFDEDGEPRIASNTGRVETTSVSEVVNIYSRYVSRQQRPQGTDDDGDTFDIPLLRLTDAQYTGERPFVDYVTLGMAPTMDLMNMSMLWFAVFGVLGYGSAVGLKRVTPKVPGGGITSQVALGGWGLYAFLLFMLSIGIVSLNGIGLGNLIGMIVWVGLMFFIGMNYPTLNRQVGQGLLGLGLVMILGHVLYYRVAVNSVLSTPEPFLTFDGGVSGWGISVGFILQLALWITVGLFAFNAGYSNEGTLRAGTRRRGLVGSFVVWLVVLVGIPFIINTLSSTSVMSNYTAQDLLPVSDMRLWGGFLLTFMLTAVGIVASFPIGVLLALGRRAHRYPAIKYTCILYIEFVRGVPLVSVLFMASLLVPLVNPELATVPGVVRAMVGITMFSAAYLAENVRGGLQSIPDGQEEAGKALGLNNVQVTNLVTLPQALRAVIPALVGQAISLFKDTSLVFIVGLADLTGVATRVVAQSEFVGRRLETFVFISVIYFIFSYVMSFVSRRIEESGSGSARRV